MKAKIAMAAACLAFTQPSAVLANPTELAILIETQPETARRCGLTEDSTLAAMRSSFRYNRITEVELENSPYAYVVINALQSAANWCAINMTVSIKSIQVSVLDDALVNSAVVFCERATLFHHRGDQSSAIYARLRDHFDECLSVIEERTY